MNIPGQCRCPSPEPALTEGGLSAICEKCGEPIAPSTVPTLLEAAKSIIKSVDAWIAMPATPATPGRMPWFGLAISWEQLNELRHAVEAEERKRRDQ